MSGRCSLCSGEGELLPPKTHYCSVAAAPEAALALCAPDAQRSELFFVFDSSRLSSKGLLNIDNSLKWRFHKWSSLCRSRAVLLSVYSGKQNIHSWPQIKDVIFFECSPLLSSMSLTMPLKRSLFPFSFQSTSPSHSVGANVQHVLHLMKQHTKALCNSRVVNDTPLAKSVSTGHPASKSRRSSLPKEYSSSQEELSEVLLTLQDEFGQMSL